MHDRSPLANRLDSQAAETFVGRVDELAAMRPLLNANGPIVVHVSGLAGVGKSTLLAAFAEEAAGNDGVVVWRLDCRLIEPTERGFLAELGQLTGENVETLGDAVATLARSGSPVVLVLDHYENFLLMDTWIRQDFMPAAPAGARLVLAGRQPPVPRWSTSPRWHGLFRALALQPLDHASSLDLLTVSGLGAREAEAMAAVAHGNPLALKLAAAAALANPSLTFQDAAVHEVMQQLTALFLADVDDPTTRDAIRDTSVARRVTRSLLKVLGYGDDTVFEALRALPFVDSLRDGLRVHDAVREAAARTLRAEDPGRFNTSRRQAWRLLREELQTAARADVWRYTADMLYLVENPVAREAFFPSGHQELAVEPAQVNDLDAVLAIAGDHEGPRAVAAVEAWWRAHPETFRVARDGDGAVTAFYCMCERAALDASVREHDPVADAWCDHLLDDPAPAGGKVLLLRRWLTLAEGEAPSAGQAACWLDVKRAYMELRPALRRVYLTVVDLPTYGPVAAQLGFQHLADWTVELDGVSYQSAMLDFGPASVDGWITRLVGDELGVVRQSPLDRDRRALLLDGQEVALTKLEYGLAEYLEDRPGATVTRDELLDAVWGHADGSGSSNVVDAVVKSLRRKLGPDNRLVETVRGHGYRWRES